jgi:RimJ/RimL family protein N-acetyltransferase
LPFRTKNISAAIPNANAAEPPFNNGFKKLPKLHSMIRLTELSDLSFVQGLYFHPKVNPFLLYEMEEEPHFEAIFADLCARKIKFIFENEHGKPIGMFKLYAHTYRANHIAYLGGVAIHPDFGGKGQGAQMMSEVLAFAQSEGYRRIELSTATINEKAIFLYEKLGFEREGVMRNYTYLKKEDIFLDEVLMSYLF